MGGKGSGRHAIEKRVRWNCSFRQSLAHSVELLLINPVTKKLSYGARSKLLEQLMREWLTKMTNLSPEEAERQLAELRREEEDV